MGTALAHSNPVKSKRPEQEGPAQSQQLPAKQNTGVMGTLQGWWDKGTDWAADKYDQASGAVSSAYNSVKKTAGDFC